MIITENQFNKLIESYNDITYYKFFNLLKKFIGDLLGDPINADIDDVFKRKGINKTDLINKLINRNVIIRKEKIKEFSNGNGNKESKMIISYDVPKKNFNRKLKRLYSELFGSKNVVTEDGECGTTNVGGSTSTFNNATYEVPFGKPQKKKMNIYDGDYQ